MRLVAGCALEHGQAMRRGSTPRVERVRQAVRSEAVRGEPTARSGAKATAKLRRSDAVGRLAAHHPGPLQFPHRPYSERAMMVASSRQAAAWARTTSAGAGEGAGTWSENSSIALRLSASSRRMA